MSVSTIHATWWGSAPNQTDHPHDRIDHKHRTEPNSDSTTSHAQTFVNRNNETNWDKNLNCQTKISDDSECRHHWKGKSQENPPPHLDTVLTLPLQQHIAIMRWLRSSAKISSSVQWTKSVPYHILTDTQPGVNIDWYRKRCKSCNTTRPWHVQ